MVGCNQEITNYIYTYSCHEDELSLCCLEMRSLFGYDTESFIVESHLRIDPSRSPFIKERIEVIARGKTLADIMEKIDGLKIDNASFKVTVIDNSERNKGEKVSFEERRQIERNIGLKLVGKVDLVQPDLVLAVMKLNESWVFGKYVKSESLWFLHQKKPQNYSTALSTRVARAVVNIAIPKITGIKAIDPCCGIGTVLLEALSMEIDMVGSDINPLAAMGARKNIAHFGYSTEIVLRDIRDVSGKYNAAIIDMPYNHCSVIPRDVQLEMLQSARKFSDKVVIVTVETIDSLIEEAGFTIVDRSVAKKSKFTRQVIVCK